MYTWGYLKENILAKLNLDEASANQLGLLSRFPFYANEAMTQICSAIKPHEIYKSFVVGANETIKVGDIVAMPNDFVAFSDDVVLYKCNANCEEYDEVGDDFVEYDGYNNIIFKYSGVYRVPYKARWFFFTKDLSNDIVIPAPADILDAIPSYVVGQCYRIDDEQKAALYRDEYESFLARIDDSTFKSQRTMHIGGGW